MPNLSLPTPGATPGPAWAQQINAALTQLAEESQSRAQGIPKFVGGRYYGSRPVTTTTLAATLNTLYATPLWVPNALSIDRIEAEVTTLIASGVVRLGIYDSTSNGNPGTRVLDAGVVATTTTGVKSITVNQALQVGLYWLVAVNQTAAATLRAISGDLAPVNQTSFEAGSVLAAYTMTGVTGALPTTFVQASVATSAPRVQVRAV